MKLKINCVLLVDDDEATNFIHKHTIKESGFAEHVRVAGDGVEALDYLNSIEDSNYIRPDLIFLDINMPEMDGWEFLEEYKQLDKELQSHMIVVMLATSLNLDVRANFETIDIIDHFMSKPLTHEVFQNLQVQFFDVMSYK